MKRTSTTKWKEIFKSLMKMLNIFACPTSSPIDLHPEYLHNLTKIQHDKIGLAIRCAFFMAEKCQSIYTINVSSTHYLRDKKEKLILFHSTNSSKTINLMIQWCYWKIFPKRFQLKMLRLPLIFRPSSRKSPSSYISIANFKEPWKNCNSKIGIINPITLKYLLPMHGSSTLKLRIKFSIDLLKPSVILAC